jgi:uncharacterized protein (DUF302 family)
LQNKIDYTIETRRDVGETVELLTRALNSKGFGVLSTIDVRKIIKQKLGEDMNDYVILDICSPRDAKQAIDAHKDVELILPCKMTVFEDRGRIMISLYKPTEAIKLLGFEDLNPLAQHAEKELRSAMDSLV